MYDKGDTWKRNTVFMKNKRKNDETSTMQTPVRSFIRNVFMFLSAILAMPLIFLLFSLIFYLFFAETVFEWINLPQVQRAVIEQCDIPDYESHGHFDTSTFDGYADWQFSEHIRIDCQQEYRSDSNWVCTCEERESN